jgi:hypothetical protein
LTETIYSKSPSNTIASADRYAKIFLSLVIVLFIAWGPLAQQAAQPDQSSSRPTLLYAFEDLVAYHLWFALRDAPGGTYKVSVIKNMPGTREDSAYFLPRDFHNIEVRGPEIPNEKDVWIAFRALRVDEQEPPLNQFVTAGYKIKRVVNERAQNQTAFMIARTEMSFGLDEDLPQKSAKPTNDNSPPIHRDLYI